MNLFVRESLNQDHVLYLAELIEGGVKLPPIKITEDMVVIDGRHRIEAHELADYIEIEAEIVKVGNEKDIIAEAYKANVGGSLPPTNQDTEHTIMLLLEHKETQKHIAEMLRLPLSLARKYIKNVQSRVARQKLVNAASDVTDGGLTVAKAAEKNDVDPEKLRGMLSGRKRRSKVGLAEIQGTLTRRYRSVSQKNARLMMSLRNKLEDGDISMSQVRKVFTHIEKLQRQSSRSIADWKKRLNGSLDKQ